MATAETDTSGRLARLFKRRPLVTVLRLNGIIGRTGPIMPGLDAAALEGRISRAFQPRRLAAVALAVNSPGGSPVQSALIYSRIRAAAEEREVPVYSFTEDVAASGGYWLAMAGDEVYANASSIVGSIGVVSRGFGLDQAIGRLGIERRVHATGPRKSALDPFRPEDPDDVKMLEGVHADVFQTFKDMVRTRRADKLKGDDDTLFSGAFWSGARALELGLVDGIGDLRTVMREKFGPRVRLKDVTPRRGLSFRPFGGGGRVGLAEDVLAALEARALWGRFGL